MSEVFRVALRLGLTSFGGPIAHLAYFRREYVDRRRWLDDEAYADLVALCQALPGPASSQLGIAIGTQRAGWAGGVAAWLGFTLPSAAILIAFGLVSGTVDLADADWVHGLKLAAVAVVALAVWAMARALTPDWPRRVMAIAAGAAALAWPSPVSQVAIIAAGALAGHLVVSRREAPRGTAERQTRVSRRAGVVALTGFAALLLALPLARAVDGTTIAAVDSYYRAGALVFGGGHVVLPLLEANVVDPGWVTEDAFLAGYGAAQAVPGPLFTVAGYLGTVSAVQPNGVVGGLLALGAIFLPSFLLVLGALPFWERLRSAPGVRRALSGTNAAVVGLLGAALYSPVATSAVEGPLDVILVGLALAALGSGRVPVLAVVVGLALLAEAIGRFA